MCTRKLTPLALAALLLGSTASLAPVLAEGGYPASFGFGQPVTADDLKGSVSVQPDGRGLPAGKGTYADGQKLYAESCAACHGDKLQGIPQAGIGGDRLIGGRGSLASETPVKTVESYWPYATTLFDYVKRAMPFSAPGSLTDDQVYSVVAYILGEANIIPKTEAMDRTTLPKVQMPNRDGFVPDPRPEIELYR